jgi:hypothetical protein
MVINFIKILFHMLFQNDTRSPRNKSDPSKSTRWSYINDWNERQSVLTMSPDCRTSKFPLVLFSRSNYWLYVIVKMDILQLFPDF